MYQNCCNPKYHLVRALEFSNLALRANEVNSELAQEINKTAKALYSEVVLEA